ncbi:MAG: hypothetical protein ACRDTX_09125 [Pseudonocardiaceae bacterium]
MAGMTGVGDERRSWRTITVSVTSARDGFEHLVAEEMMTPRNPDHCVALCGRTVWAAALVCPPGRRCPVCIAVRDADSADRPRRRRPNRRGAWTRLNGPLRGPLRPNPSRPSSPM